MVAVEVVKRADQRRRFHELGRVLFAGEHRWAPPLASYERWLFDRRHPYVRATGAEVVRFLARDGGRVVGRIAGHRVAGSQDAWFGAFDCIDDAAAVAALVGAVRDWAAGAGRLAGPAMFTPGDGDAGILVEGFDHAGGTARPWHPPWYAQHLTAAGLAPVGAPMPRWRLAAAGTPTMPAGGAVPPHAGRLADAALALTGPAGDVAAVPDVSTAARTTSLRRPPPATEASIVRCDGDPSVLVPALLAAAHDRGYTHVWAPWSPDDRPPDTVHSLFGRN